ncbi:hypothetical protein PR048_030244 [Dryococelus australis]|uniref:Uncharacterized protein n=1 Tax=Dryococelus australis TaxID=614101 RepID=A0ABQ9G8F0_9NEOP|nr:hypothetical protein PR048_030244 [Dryococelus australis]
MPKTVKIILVFSHGNAFTEGSFSISKEILVKNLHEDRAWDGIQDKMQVKRMLQLWIKKCFVMLVGQTLSRRKQL